MAFHEWLKTAWADLLHWFGVEEQKLASFLYPVLQDAKVLIEKDLLKDVIDGLPIIIAALEGGGIGAAIDVAVTHIVPVLTAQGVALAHTTINTLANALVAQAQVALAKA